MRLAGDIGGTKALLALFDEASPAPHFVISERLACARYTGFAPLLAEFLAATNLPMHKISGGCLAVAGPLADDGRRAKLTNLPWTVDTDALSREFGMGRLTLVNDFAAAALGVTAAAAADMVTLQKGEFIEHGVRVVVGAGTGLGMAVLVHDGDTWRVLPGEGGHLGFAPADERQAALLTHLKQIHGRVEYEHVVSGPGLAQIYRFLAGAQADPALLAAPDLAAAIAVEAAQQSNGIARQALDLFLAAYGAFAGDVALALMARGGVFLAGGIAARILPLMQSGVFIGAFNAKGTHSALAARMPVYVVTDPTLGLKGAALHDRLP
jgi:glucokinase